ncbi:MAG TPA: nitric oxide synthase oxygenase [Propionibacteriaceae bacterium]|nr:nitric oxide synthase oxygenase [Propionibacteriaceae bacterium]
MDLAPPTAHAAPTHRLAPSPGPVADRPNRDTLTWLARHAWRLADRCVGRSGWKSLLVRDRTDLIAADEIVDDLEVHLRLTTNGGRMRAVATIYNPAIRFRAEQLIRYAGDPQYAGYAATCRRLGWRSNGDPFDILPVIFELPDGTLHLASLDPGVILEVPIRHPAVSWCGGTELRWHAAPVISNMLLRNDGQYWPCIFGGWYETDEIAGRDLAPARRFNVLPMVADSIGLSRDPRIEPLWQDLALGELHRAVVHSFRRAGVMFSTPQQEAERFRRHVDREHCVGRSIPTDRTWLMPATNPILCSTDEIAEYDPPTPGADPQYVHVPRFHRMGRHGWERDEDRRPGTLAWCA